MSYIVMWKEKKVAPLQAPHQHLKVGHKAYALFQEGFEPCGCKSFLEMYQPVYFWSVPPSSACLKLY